ncbi:MULTISPECIES: DUF1542 domain-containing protein [Lacticaseibacillus]|uniref:DUF1542 domain-containing protein n=1 Tax=Lacticaseibacillus huelsenbergensis TaxID=3035291 RepID=A0ABY8DSL1_9LACO|nr:MULTISPECIES: DUF1542 domain-containing protein [Lacticaseibacillus]MDG3062079.1 DUF1542 domain-containing protein [Lacticaseibacillus sp. BCRC 81376]WFB39984.1 DUF1542 domain-containing protein [Lacticaseibacillus huelsenbergensis]
MESKVHYKRYKSGKFWVTALISISLGTFGVITIPQIFEAVPVYADTTPTDITATVKPDEFLNFFQLGGGTDPSQGSAVHYPSGELGFQVQLTPDVPGQIGTAALKTKIDMNKSFKFQGRLFLGTKANAADGVAFGFADEDPGKTGKAGNTFGIGTLKNAFGVKFDEYYNGQEDPGSYFKDPGVETDYPQMRVIQTVGPLGKVKSIEGAEGEFYQKLEDPKGQYLPLLVDYNGDSKRLTVAYGNKSISFDAKPYIQNDQLSMFIIGSTGDQSNQHLFDFESFTYTPGLDAVKADLKNRLATEADTQKAAVNSDPTLTTPERQKQVTDINTALKTGQDAIDAATTTPDAVHAFDTNKPLIIAIHQSGLPLDQRKANKKAELKTEHDNIITAINNDPTLTSDQKNQQRGNADTALTNGNTAIDGATDADKVDQAFLNGKKAIDDAHQPGATLDEQKTAKKQALEDAATKVKQDIQNDTTLTTDEKKAQTDNVDTALTAGRDAINKADTADAINTAAETGLANIQKAHQPGLSLDEQKKAQKKALKDKYDQVVNDINNDPTLTTAQKKPQIKNATDAFNQGNQDIDNAATADAISQASTTSQANIDNAHQAGKPLEDQKNAQRKRLTDEATAVKKKIQDDVTLTKAQKATQTTAVDQALTDGLKNINDAKTADDINTAADAGITDIDKAYQTGTPLDAQKAAMKTAIDNAATKAKKDIQDDPTLTNAEKQQQIDAVDKAATVGKDAIDAATSADDIKTATDDAITNINKAHQPGKSLDDQKENKKAAIDNAATDAKKAIQDDPTLTTAEKQQQSDAVDKAAENGKTAIDGATNADAINTAADTAITAIGKIHQPGKLLDEQKDAKKTELDNEATKVKKDIQGDPTLTTAEKKQQTDDVDKALKDGKAAIDAAKDADSINQAFSDGKTNIDNAYQPGRTLDEQKKDQKKALEEEGEKVKQAIKDDPTLTTAEKNQQIAEVDKAVKDGGAAIDAGTNTDEVNKAFTDAKQNVDQAHKSGTDINDQKDAKKKLLDEEAVKVKQAIQDDPTLTTAEKKQQTENADKALKDGKAAIDAAKNADEINQAFDTGKANIDNAHQPGASIDDQKAAQKKSLIDEATKVKQEIQDDPTLTTAEKQQQSENVDQALKDGEAAIDAATNPDDINQAFDTGKVNIDNAHKPGTSLDDQKAAQKKSLVDEAAKVKKDIQDDPTLTTAEKDQQAANVDQALKDGEAAIDAATNADDINKAFETGKVNIDNAHQPGKSIDDQKNAQKKLLDEEAAKVNQDIQNDSTLTAEEKKQQTENVDKALKDGNAAIDAATNADDINKAFVTGKTNIDNAHQPGTSLDDQKAAQKKSLADEAAKVKQDIQDDPTLMTAEKQQQSENVDKAFKDGEAAIDAAKNTDEINQAFDTGKANIDKAHQPGTAIDDQQTARKKALDEEAAKVKKDIQDDPTLTTAEKTQQSADVDKALTDGKAAIDAAKTADDINKAFDTGKTNIDNAHQPGKLIDDQKTAQKKSLDEEAAKVKQDIQNDPTLTTTEKQQQADNVDKARQDGQAAIDAATNVDDINQAFETGKINIDNAHQPGKSLDDQKAAQKKSLDEEAAKVKKDIQGDPTLTTAEKQQQSENVDKARKDGQAAIDAATNADDINHAFETGKVNIDNAHQPGKTLDEQKTVQKKSLDEEAAKVKQDIQNDPTLTTTEKQQAENVDKAHKDGQAAIDAATTPDEVNQAFATGKANIDAQHQPGKSLADQRSTATTKIDKEAAKVKQQIDNDPLLTDTEKANQKAKADHEATLAKEALAKAIDADALNAALADGIKKIDAQYVPGTAKTPTPDPATKPLTVDPRSTTTRPLSTTLTPTSSLPRTGDKPATGLAALGAFILSMFGFALTGKKRKRS